MSSRLWRRIGQPVLPVAGPATLVCDRDEVDFVAKQRVDDAVREAAHPQHVSALDVRRPVFRERVHLRILDDPVNRQRVLSGEFDCQGWHLRAVPLGGGLRLLLGFGMDA